MIHSLKTLPEFFEEVASGRKTFEIRQNDRNFRVGNFIALNEYNGEYTGRFILAEITYILDNPVYCREGMIAFSFAVCWILDKHKNSHYTEEKDRRSCLPVYGGERGAK